MCIDFLFTPQWRSEAAGLLHFWPQWGVRVALLFSFLAECRSLGEKVQPENIQFPSITLSCIVATLAFKAT
jgi:hypothetical protein